MTWYFSTLWAIFINLLTHAWPLLLVAVICSHLWIAAYLEARLGSVKAALFLLGLLSFYCLIAFFSSPFWAV
jgi:hypothetical protein